MKKLSIIAIAFLTTTTLFSQTPPGLSLIRQEDLKKDLHALADAHFNGRSAGTSDELKVAANTIVYLSSMYQKIKGRKSNPLTSLI